MATFIAKNGGKFGEAAVAYLEWQFRNNTEAKAKCWDSKSPDSLVSDGWQVEAKELGLRCFAFHHPPSSFDVRCSL